jgi:hypothetical protein
LRQLAHANPFGSRNDTLIWRGRLQTYAFARRKWKKELEVRARNATRPLFRDDLNIEFDGAFVPVTEMCSYRYLLHLPGNGYSSRLKYLYFCAGLVFRDTRDSWAEWWSIGLKKDVHFVEVELPLDAWAALRRVRRNPLMASRILANAQALVDSIPDADVYLCNLISEYAKRVQLYDPDSVALGPGAVDLASSLLDPHLAQRGRA